jgi:hypothetical protein
VYINFGGRIIIHVCSFISSLDTKPLVYDGYNDEYNIFSSPTFEEKISYDYNMPPIFNDYGDDNNYFCESAPTTIVHMGSINYFMHVAHDRDVLCDGYCRGLTR